MVGNYFGREFFRAATEAATAAPSRIAGTPTRGYACEASARKSNFTPAIPPGCKIPIPFASCFRTFRSVALGAALAAIDAVERWAELDFGVLPNFVAGGADRLGRSLIDLLDLRSSARKLAMPLDLPRMLAGRLKMSDAMLAHRMSIPAAFICST
jgi:hypothetical protein